MAYNLTSSSAISLIAFFTLFLALFHSLPPSLLTFGELPSLPIYFCTKSSCSTGTNNLSSLE